MNERLYIMAERVGKNRTMADIGTDHGFLPIHLIDNYQCSKAICVDISGPSLKKAKDNCRRMLTDEQLKCVDFREGDGIKVLEKNEVDVVVIAGMGGRLIKNIINNDLEVTKSFSKLILQPRNGQGQLRKWLLDNSFSIENENLVDEGNHIAEIITVTPLKNGNRNRSMTYKYMNYINNNSDREIVYQIPPWVSKAEGPVTRFLEQEICRRKIVLESIMMAKHRNIIREHEICEEIRYLTHLAEERNEQSKRCCRRN